MEILCNGRVVAVVTEDDRSPKFFAKWLARAVQAQTSARDGNMHLRGTGRRLSGADCDMAFDWLALRILAARQARYKNQMRIDRRELAHLKLLAAMGFFRVKGASFTITMPKQIDDSVVRTAIRGRFRDAQ
jgi:hypothetical protein